MASDLDLARACAAAYTATPTIQVGDVAVVLTEAEGALIVAVRGTRINSMEDVLRDLDAVPLSHPVLGDCDAGFLGGAESVWPLLAPRIKDRDTIFTGHSMGGSIAIGLGGLAVVAGIVPLALVTFAAARVGGADLKFALRSVPTRQYARNPDRVWTVPFWFSNLVLLTMLPDADDPITAHEIGGFVAAMEAKAADLPGAGPPKEGPVG